MDGHSKSRDHHRIVEIADENDRRLKRTAMDASGVVSAAGTAMDADASHGDLVVPENDKVLATVPVEALDAVFEVSFQCVIEREMHGQIRGCSEFE